MLLPENYKGCEAAVRLHEMDGAKNAWLLARETMWSREEVLKSLIKVADEILSVFPTGPLAFVRPQMDNPEFLRYVGDKLAEEGTGAGEEKGKKDGVVGVVVLVVEEKLADPLSN